MISGVCTLKGLPGDFRFNAEVVCWKLRIHNMILLFREAANGLENEL